MDVTAIKQFLYNVLRANAKPKNSKKFNFPKKEKKE